jgi:hypothetical protein
MGAKGSTIRPVGRPASSGPLKECLHETVNLKTAKALGLTIPLSILARASEVIE